MYPLASSDPQHSSTPASPRFPEIEERVLAYWEKDHTFQASIDQRPAETADGEPNEFVFYDGPPFANGLPHYGHLLTGYVKDLVARYQTQQGRRVERRFGWDTHGLPAELEAMKQLGMTDKAQIEAMGIDRFNDACRSSVLRYTEEWKDYVQRQARWVDFENDYKTLNPSFMESVIWAFASLHEKGLTYQGFRVLPYCWKDETPLSNHELRMDDDVYQQRQDPSVTVSFPLTGERLNTTDAAVSAADDALAAELAGVEVLAWTTTPWTLPTNQALAVGPQITYAVVPAGPEAAEDQQGKRFLLAQDRVAAHATDLGYPDAAAVTEAITGTYEGARLGGLRYAPLFTYFTDAEAYGTQNAWQILVDDYVSTEDGTGVVHQAPAYGEDDQRVCEAHGIPVVLSVDEGARFLPLFGDPQRGDGVLQEIAGVQVFEANRTIIRSLRSAGRLLREASYEHSYPHCWRCRNPLIYRAITSWYVKVTEFKDRMLELNQQINWIPDNVKDGQFGRWLENARDWSISRNRYWGSPIPVWECDGTDARGEACTHHEVFGSLEALNERFGRLPRNAEGEVDLHRPWIDELTAEHEGCGGTLRRVEDVLDVWFDSGSMPYAQVHYPFEHRDWFDGGHHPADFIVEYIGQTRGWFYTMHVLSTALFDRPAFSNVISHGIVLGSDGQKMSKSLRNYPDVSEVLDRDGSDAMRWFLMASPILRGGNLVVTEEGIREGTRQVLLPIWNVWHFFSLYANSVGGPEGTGYRAQTRHTSSDPLDEYLLAATGRMLTEVKAALDAYEVSDACDALRTYVDTLTNWYVRRSRERFYVEDTQALDVLYTCLEAFCRAAAPLMPLVAEEIWRGLTGGRSVHLTDYPDPAPFFSGFGSGVDSEGQAQALVERMDTVRRIASVGSSLRKSAQRRVRLPLPELTVVVPDAQSLQGALSQIIAEELNLKSVRLLDATEAAPADFGISQHLAVNARAAGPRLGKQVQQAIKGAKSGDWSVAEDGTVTAGGIDLQEGEYTLETTVGASSQVADQKNSGQHDDDAPAEETAAQRAVAVVPGGFLVLDTSVSDELAAEGTARDVVRAVQSARKAAGLEVSDRVHTVITGPAPVLEAVRAHQELVCAETLTLQLDLQDSGAEDTRRDPADDATKSVQVEVSRA